MYLKFDSLVEKAWGKIHSLADMWLVKRYGKQFTGHKNKPRNYRWHPVTAEEQKTLDRMKQVVAAYRQLKKSPTEMAALEQEFLAQKKKKHGIHTNMYAYFVHREMLRLSHSGVLAADPSAFIHDWSLKKR